jgi:L-alanine-DL-glutamate epimerase-like enolase superfamily enzyme
MLINAQRNDSSHDRPWSTATRKSGLRPTEPRQSGRYHGAVQVFSIATVRNVTVMLHSFYDGPGLLAAIHATAALGGSQAMFEWREFDLEAQIYGGAPAPKGGRIPVPQTPGLGIEPDPDVIRTCARYNQ